MYTNADELFLVVLYVGSQGTTVNYLTKDALIPNLETY